MNNSEIGVMIIPRKLPKIELKIAAVSFPCAALVRITALETGGGIHATVINPLRIQTLMPKIDRILTII